MTLHAGWEKKVKDRRNRKNNNQDTMKRNLHCLNKENEKKIRGRIFSVVWFDGHKEGNKWLEPCGPYITFYATMKGTTKKMQFYL